MNTKEIIIKLQVHQRKKQNVMNTKEIIIKLQVHQRKKQNVMNTKEIMVLQIFLLSY